MTLPPRLTNCCCHKVNLGVRCTQSHSKVPEYGKTTTVKSSAVLVLCNLSLRNKVVIMLLPWVIRAGFQSGCYSCMLWNEFSSPFSRSQSLTVPFHFKFNPCHLCFLPSHFSLIFHSHQFFLLLNFKMIH